VKFNELQLLSLPEQVQYSQNGRLFNSGIILNKCDKLIIIVVVVMVMGVVQIAAVYVVLSTKNGLKELVSVYRLNFNKCNK
jgi:hypothetical protein